MALTRSGWPEGTGSRFRREPEIGKLAGNLELAGFGTTNQTGAPFQVGAGSKGINSRILLPLSTFVQLLSRAFRAPKRWLAFVAFRLNIALLS